MASVGASRKKVGSLAWMVVWLFMRVYSEIANVKCVLIAHLGMFK